MISLPEPGLGDDSIAETSSRSAPSSSRDGMIPWFAGGHGDPWNHVEAAMALTVGGALRRGGPRL